jgi:hypothetical protein
VTQPVTQPDKAVVLEAFRTLPRRAAMVEKGDYGPEDSQSRFSTSWGWRALFNGTLQAAPNQRWCGKHRSGTRQCALVAAVRPAVERRHPPDALMRLANPLVRRMVARGRLGDQVLVLHYVGRRSGRRCAVPAGYNVIDGLVSVFTSSGWRYNFAGGRDVEFTLKGVRQSGRAVLFDDSDDVAESCERLIGELGISRAARRLGLRINVNRAPTRGELVEAVERSGLSIVRIYPHSFPPRLSVVHRRAG